MIEPEINEQTEVDCITEHPLLGGACQGGGGFRGSPNANFPAPSSAAPPPAPEPTVKPERGRPPPPPPPSAICNVICNNLHFGVEITHVVAWATDGGERFKKEVSDQKKGCGGVTSWVFEENSKKEGRTMKFAVPLTIGAGCVEKAMKAVGGPSMSCYNTGCGA